MCKTRVSQASLSEKLMRLKQELATTAELVNGVLRREQLRREASQQAKVVWEKCEDFATCVRWAVRLHSHRLPEPSKV